MKIHVQRNKGQEEYILSIPSSIDFIHMQKGEKFTANVLSVKGEKKEFICCFLADGKSLLVGNKIIRYNHNFVEKKGEHYRLGIKNNSYIYQTNYLANVIKPIKPRINAASLLGGEIKSPMTGKVISVLVSEQTKVKEGDALIIIEAMKMENRIVAECDGVVSKIKVSKGVSVAAGDFMLFLAPVLQG